MRVRVIVCVLFDFIRRWQYKKLNRYIEYIEVRPAVSSAFLRCSILCHATLDSAAAQVAS